MRIENRTRKTLVGTRVDLASTWWGRFKGFIGRQEPIPGEGILLWPCNAVHTYGMSFDLDILFLDERGRVLEMIRSFAPWKKTSRVPGARYVLEGPPGMIEESQTEVGDLLTWWDPAPRTVSDRILNRKRTEPQPLTAARETE
jgi:uncharacterized membrane protein (UPF0127 family)